ncbi:MAG TPA: hypothetical protein VHN13_18015 [Candidatus Tectomicrobia bacterium]|jgi:hypothetical protein|nr:hypothetical protein [Candidatus Tectomicrobia bacterium]
MLLAVDLVIVTIVALVVLLFVAGAKAIWRRRGRKGTASERRPTSGVDPVTAVTHQARRHPVGRRCSGTQGLEYARRLPRSSEVGVERGIIKIVAVYRTYPVMVVGETADGALLERPLHELADAQDLLPSRLWQELVERYHVFQIR